MDKIKRFWYFRLRNGVVRKGEKGGFRWTFRRFWLDVETVSGNWRARWMADEHPYGYLMAGPDDDNIHGFCQMMYLLGKTLTTDQVLVNGIQRELKKYESRLSKAAAEDETEEKASLEFEKQVQEYMELPKKERRKVGRATDRKFKKTVKDLKSS